MTDKEIIRMAREAGLPMPFVKSEQVKRFADLVLRAERQACAEALREALAPVPVAWMDREGDLYKMPEIQGWAPPHTLLYTAPPQRKPLTNGEIYTAYITSTNQALRPQDERLAFAFARAIERAHGIKEEK